MPHCTRKSRSHRDSRSCHLGPATQTRGRVHRIRQDCVVHVQKDSLGKQAAHGLNMPGKTLRSTLLNRIQARFAAQTSNRRFEIEAARR
jgi:hypothetical protein